MRPWKKGIDNASNISGLDPHLIGGIIWAESHGNPDSASNNPDGKTRDLGLMQVSQVRWDRYVMPNLTAAEKKKIKQVTGKDASQLDMSNPNENIIAGSLEMQQWIRQAGSLEGGLNGYMTGGGYSVGWYRYVHDVQVARDSFRTGDHSRLPWHWLRSCPRQGPVRSARAGDR